MNILPQITQITQRGMQQAALSRRERQVGDGCEIIEVIVVLLFVFCLRKSAKSAGDFWVSLVYID